MSGMCERQSDAEPAYARTLDQWDCLGRQVGAALSARVDLGVGLTGGCGSQSLPHCCFRRGCRGERSEGDRPPDDVGGCAYSYQIHNGSREVTRP